jgi:alpha-beta hydrolase superfamily lysophospholipase
MGIMRTALAAALICAGLAACSNSGSSGNDGNGGGTDTVAATSNNVSFTVDGTQTYGTLEIPAHKKGAHLAAALLLVGSGPTDRNGDQPPNLMPETLELIAGVLAQEGIMTLRYDKYFTGQTGGGAFASHPATLSLNAYIRQADAAYTFLRDQPQTDKSKMLVLGHSEGGFYAMLVDDTVVNKPAGLALIEPQDARLLTLIQVQFDEALSAAVRAGQMSLSVARVQAHKVATAIAAFREGHQPSLAGIVPAFAQTLSSMLLSPSNINYDRTDDEISPVAAAQKVAPGTRVLVTDGTADTNIPPSTIGPLVRALRAAGTTGPGLQRIQGMNHDLHLPGTAANDPVLAPAVVAAIKAWAAPYASTAS